MEFDELCRALRKLERRLQNTTDPVRKAEITCEIERLYWEIEGE